MAGKICPSCEQQTFFETSTGRKCSKCSYTMTVAANDGKGGKGSRCSNCNEYKVFSSKCRGCGASYSK